MSIHDEMIPWREHLKKCRLENEKMFKTIEGHNCHPDTTECCEDCLKLNGYDVTE